MRPLDPRFTFALVCTLAMAAGCKSSGPTDADYDDVAVAVGALVANDSGGEVGSMEDSVSLAQGVVPSGLSSQTGDGNYEGTFLGLHYAYTLTCKDVNGTTLGACDATTDSANLVVDWGGELHLSFYDGSVTRTGDWTLSGLSTSMAHFDGHGTFDVSSEFRNPFNGAIRTFLLDYDGQYSDVTYDLVDSRFAGGSIVYTVHAHRTRTGPGRDVDAEFDMLVTIQFDGSGSATMTLDGERIYLVNLASGDVTKR